MGSFGRCFPLNLANALSEYAGPGGWSDPSSMPSRSMCWTNSEVIDIDQDSLGRQARIVRQTPTELVPAKPLEDGSVALGLFNLGTESASISADLSALNLRGPVQVRDVWRQRSLRRANGRYSARVASHGVLLVRLRS